MGLKASVLTTYNNPDKLKISWLGFAASGDVGDAIEFQSFNDRSVQIVGDLAGSIEITFEGSNDSGVTWKPITDPQGNTIVKTALALEAITELTEWVRPRANAGTGGANIDVHLMMYGKR